MSAGERKTALLVLRDRVSGRMEAAHRVALFAHIVIGSGRELPIVHVSMAIKTFGVGDLVTRRGAGGHVAFVARNTGVFAFQRISAGGVLPDAEQRRLPAFHGVTCGALAAILAPGELSAVRIGTVAVGTFCECHGLFEISAGVASDAINLQVLPQKRIASFGMIELQIFRNLFPARGGVAGLARLRKSSVMWIGVAVAAFCERNACEAGLPAGRRGCVAFFAGYPRV